MSVFIAPHCFKRALHCLAQRHHLNGFLHAALDIRILNHGQKGLNTGRDVHQLRDQLLTQALSFAFFSFFTVSAFFALLHRLHILLQAESLVLESFTLLYLLRQLLRLLHILIQAENSLLEVDELLHSKLKGGRPSLDRWPPWQHHLAAAVQDELGIAAYQQKLDVLASHHADL